MNHLLLTLLALALLPPHPLKAQTLSPQEVYLAVSADEAHHFLHTLCQEAWEGRQAGSEGYLQAARWVARQLSAWGWLAAPGTEEGLQYFPQPHTRVEGPGGLTLLVADDQGRMATHPLSFPEDYYPCPSARGELKAELVYVGSGISAPELGHDDYRDLDVRGKVVVILPELPVPTPTPVERELWAPFSGSVYRAQNAIAHGAAGMVFLSRIANPGLPYRADFLAALLDASHLPLLLQGSGLSEDEIKTWFARGQGHRSVPLRTRIHLQAQTTHHPDTRCANVLFMLPGSDPSLDAEFLQLGAHLDGVGHQGAFFPGALDNASGCVDLLLVAKALGTGGYKPRRTILLSFFGAEEVGLVGSRHLLDHPVLPQAASRLMINLDMVGNGTGFLLSGGESMPGVLRLMERINHDWVHRPLKATPFRKPVGRPRSDGAVYARAGHPTLGIWSTGKLYPFYYHDPRDRPEVVSPDFMKAVGQWLALSLLELGHAPSELFRWEAEPDPAP